MTYRLEDLTKLQTLLRVDLATRLSRALEKESIEVSMSCSRCGAELRSWESNAAVRIRNITWLNACRVCGRPDAQFGFHDPVRGGQTWETWRVWDTGRMHFQKHESVVQAIWDHVYDMPKERIFRNTKPMILRRPLIEELREQGWNLTFREPVRYDAPPSMETRYEAAALWEVSFPDKARVWNCYSLPEYMELQQLVVKLIDEHDSLVEDAVLDSPGSLEGEVLKRLKTRCFEIKLVDRKEGEGAFKLLAFLRGTLREAREVA
jgi:hypothetical protein